MEEGVLLKWLKKDWTGVEDMRAAVAAVEAAQTNPANRTIWWVAFGFSDALFAKAITDQGAVARLANRVEQQLKRLMEVSATVAERLMREALFAVARARPANEHVRNVQDVFQLSGSVPASFELKGQTAPQIPALRSLREVIGNAKTAWNKVASGHQPSIANFRDLAVQMRDRAAELKQADLSKIAAEVATLAARIGDAPGNLTDGMAGRSSRAASATRTRPSTGSTKAIAPSARAGGSSSPGTRAATRGNCTTSMPIVRN